MTKVFLVWSNTFVAFQGLHMNFTTQCTNAKCCLLAVFDAVVIKFVFVFVTTMTSPSTFTGRCRGVKCRHFPGFTALSHLAIATKISHSYHFHPTTNIPPNHQSWRMKIKNGCGKWFCKAPKKVWTAILDFIRRQEYFGGIIAMMPPKYPLPTLWERACQRLWCASDWSYCLGIAASNLVSHTMQMARTSGGDTKSLAVSARFFILEQSN